MRRPNQAISPAESAAFSSLMLAGRRAASLSQLSASESIEQVLCDRGRGHLAERGVEGFVRWLEEDAPPTPIASPHRLDAALSVYGLTWSQVLDVLNVGHESRWTLAPETGSCARCGARAESALQVRGVMSAKLCFACLAGAEALIRSFIANS